MKTLLEPNKLAQLSSLDRSDIDAIDLGVVKLDDQGQVLLYNKTESEIVGIAPDAAEGRNFFTQVAPCTNNRLMFGRFKSGVASGELNFCIPYTFTYKMRPTNVFVQLYRDSASETNWVIIQRR